MSKSTVSNSDQQTGRRQGTMDVERSEGAAAVKWQKMAKPDTKTMTDTADNLRKEIVTRVKVGGPD